MKKKLWLSASRFLVVLSLFFTTLSGLASPSVTRLSDAPHHNLSSQAQWFRDPTATLTISEVANLPDSQLRPLQTDLSLGFTKDVVWIKVTLSREAETDPRNWYLVLGQPLLRDARLYKPLEHGGFAEQYGTQLNGQSIPEINHRRPVFRILQQELGQKTYWIRIQTPTAMNTSLKVVKEKIFLTATARESFFWGLMFGGYIITIIFYIAFWTWTRESIHKTYIGYILINFLAALFTSGWPTELETGLSSSTWITFLGIWISISILTGTKFSIEFIDLKNKNPKLSALLNLLAYIMTTAGIVMITLGYYIETMPFLQAYTMALIFTFITISINYSLKKDSKSQFFLFAFGVFYFGVFFRYLRNVSIIEPNFWNENAYQIAAFMHLLVMSIGIFSNYNKLRKEKQIAELRADAELKLREEQREFLSLVSHEFRTPITISSASIDNLLQQPDLNPETLKRINKIQRANERMESLMDNYLSKERLLMNAVSLNLKNANINQLCQLAISDMHNSDIANIKVEIIDQVEIKCDVEMIRIAINNLLQNALRYSPEPGSIKISAKMKGKIMIMKVSDQGPGIPDNEIDLIFTRYFRGNNSMKQPGAGLGLTLVKMIVEKHGGNITVCNLPNTGCEFTLVFPQ